MKLQLFVDCLGVVHYDIWSNKKLNNIMRAFFNQKNNPSLESTEDLIERIKTTISIDDVKKIIKGTNDLGFAALVLAAKQNNSDLVKKIIKAGGKVNSEQSFFTTPLHWAVINKNLDLIFYLVDRGADIKVADESGNLPLHLLKSYNDITEEQALGVISVLAPHELCLGNRMIIDCIDKDGFSILHLAVMYENIALVKGVLTKGAQVNCKTFNISQDTAIHLAAKRNNIDMMRVLVEEFHADFDIENLEDWIKWAAVNGNSLLINYLIEIGQDVNAPYNFNSLLMLAARNNNLEACMLFVGKGANVNFRDGNAMSPLLWAASHNNFEACKLFVRNGAETNVRDRYGNAPLMLAVNHNNPGIIRLLVANKSDVNTKNNDGLTVLQMSVLNNTTEAITALVSLGAETSVLTQQQQEQFEEAIAVGKAELETRHKIHQSIFADAMETVDLGIDKIICRDLGLNCTKFLGPRDLKGIEGYHSLRPSVSNADNYNIVTGNLEQIHEEITENPRLQSFRERLKAQIETRKLTYQNLINT